LFIERTRATDELHSANLRLLAERQSLQESNIAMKGVLDSVESSKREGLLQVQANIDRLVLPLLRKLETGANSGQASYLELLNLNLRDITSPFVSKLEARYSRLSPREVEISRYIRDGLTSKDIAAVLSTSEGTVRNQRKSIRKKLGITNDKTNLASLLKAI